MTTDQLFSQLGLSEADDQYKANILAKILETANLRFARVVDEVMSEEDQEEFGRFVEGKGVQEIMEWIEQRYEGIGGMYTTILEDIVEDIKSMD